MTRDDAVEQLKGFFELQQIDSPGLNERDLGGAMLGTTPVYFEYLGGEQALRCRALVYRFQAPARPALLQALGDEGRRRGEEVEYVPEGQALCLVKTYGERAQPEQMATDLYNLVLASGHWSDEVLPRIGSAS